MQAAGLLAIMRVRYHVSHAARRHTKHCGTAIRYARLQLFIRQFWRLVMQRIAAGGAGRAAYACYAGDGCHFASGKVEKRQLLPRIHMVRFC
jgi:hypothetical protein